MVFSELLSTLMYDRGETAYRLAKELHVSQSTVANWTGGISIPQVHFIKDISDHYGINRAEVEEACEKQRRIREGGSNF